MLTIRITNGNMNNMNEHLVFCEWGTPAILGSIIIKQKFKG